MAAGMGIGHAIKNDAALWTGGLIFLLFFMSPLVFFLVSATDDDLLAAIRELSRERETYRILLFTTGQAALSAAISILVAFPGAYLVSHFNFPLKRFMVALSLVPFVLPSVVVIICMISFYGKSGVINQLLGTDLNIIYSFGGILLAHIYYNSSLASRIIGDGWQRIDPRFYEIAKNLGDSNVRIFARITMPLLVPSIATSFILIFIYCFLSFGIVLVFGGIRFATLEVKIYQEMFMKLNLSKASLYAIMQLIVSISFASISGRTILRYQNANRRSRSDDMRLLRDQPAWNRIVLGSYAVAAALFLLGPLVAMALRVFSTDGSISLVNFRSLFIPEVSRRNIEGIIRSSVPGVILRSVGTAILSGTLTFTLALAISFNLRRRKSHQLETFFQVPLGVSLVSLCIGLRLLYGNLIPAYPLVVIAQVFVGFPFVFRLLKTSVEELHESNFESAQSLGARPFRILLDIVYPLLKRRLLNGYAFSLAIPFADLTAVLAVGRGTVATFPVAIYRLMGFRSFDLALTLALIYVALCFLLFLWIDSTSMHDERRGT